MFSRICASLLLVLLTFSAEAFLQVGPRRNVLGTTSRPCQQHVLGMSEAPMEDFSNMKGLGETERLLLEAKQRRVLGLKQEYGVTIKKDGLDALRAVVWQLFYVSNALFMGLAAALSFGLMLNLMGYGYYFDGTTNSMVFDTLQNIRQDDLFAAESARLSNEIMQNNKF